jgi:hypothetical protein
MKLYISEATLRTIEKFGSASLTHISATPSDHMSIELDAAPLANEASKPAVRNCQTGWADFCLMAKHDGVTCPSESCDIDDGVRAAPLVEQYERGALSLDVESVNYSIELSIEQFEKLEGVDFLDIVLPRMKKAGAGDVEYNGHFGPNVFFTSSEDDAPAVLSVVCDLVGTKARAASTSANVASKPAALDQGYVTVLIKRMQDYCDSLAPPMARGLMAEAVRALRAASTSSGRCFFCGEPMDGTHEQDCPQANDSANVAQGAEAVATVKVYETYTGQDGWIEVTQEEYDRTKDKYEHRIRRVPAPPAQTALTGRVLTYRNQPDNVGAWRLGEACRRAAELPAGDYIDRGLGLLKELQAKGYGVIALTAAQAETRND